MSIKRGITKIEIVVAIGIIAVLTLFFSPRFLIPKEQRQEALIRANVSIAASQITSHFALKTGRSLHEITEFVVKNLNQTTKNPIVKENSAYTINSVSEGTVVFVINEEEKSVELKGYSRDINKPLLVKTLHTYDDK